jgi:hypothetical protein
VPEQEIKLSGGKIFYREQETKLSVCGIFFSEIEQDTKFS